MTRRTRCSWCGTDLLKREAYRKAFHRFNPERIARASRRDVRRLMVNDHLTGCYRHPARRQRRS